MIIFDANILITLATTEESDETYERLAGLVQDLVASKTVIGIPAPAWAEYLCGTDVATTGIIGALKKKSSIRILPYGEVAAFETALIHRGATVAGKKKGAAKAPWQQVKIDRQILAIARENRVTTIYSDDSGMVSEASRLGIEVINSADIPLKPKQNKLDFDCLAEESEQSSSDMPQSTPTDGW